MPDFPCMKCRKRTDAVDRGMYRRFVHREAAEYLCLSCLAEKFKVSEESLRERAETLKEDCALFY